MTASTAPDPSVAPIDRTRRAVVGSVLGAGLLVTATPSTRAAEGGLAAAIRAFTQGAPVAIGRVELDIAPLVENGNAVPLTVNVASPMTAADHVRAIGVFNERNPQNDVAVFQLGPRAGRARVSTRVRLATSQKLVAVAQMSDGTYWQQSVDVIVTLAACIES